MQGCLICGFAIVVLFLLIIIILLPALMLSHYIALEDVNDATSYNWSADFISDMKVVKKGQRCPPYYSDFIQFRWPGTVQGCYCSTEKLVHRGECCNWAMQEGQFQRQCQCFWTNQEVHPVQKREFNYWRGEGLHQTIRICAKWIPNYNLMTRKQDGINGCRSDEVACGDRNQNIDTFFCVPQSYDCPIRSFSFTSKDIQINRENTDLYPLVELRIGEGGGVCLVNHHQNLDQKHKPYNLQKHLKEKCQIDRRFQSIDSSNERNFFIINDSLDLENKLPLFSLKDDITYNLFTRNVIPISIGCREQADHSMFINSSLEYLEICASLLIILGAVYIVLVALTCFGFTTMFIYRGCISIGYIIIFIFMYIEILDLSVTEDKKDKQCFDKETVQFLDQLNDRSTFYLSISFHLAIVLLIGVCQIFFLMYINNRLDLYCYQNDPDDQRISSNLSGVIDDSQEEYIEVNEDDNEDDDWVSIDNQEINEEDAQIRVKQRQSISVKNQNGETININYNSYNYNFKLN